MRKIESENMWKLAIPCRHPEHDPPGMIVLEEGVYEHECPCCGEKQRVIIPRKPWCCVQQETYVNLRKG